MRETEAGYERDCTGYERDWTVMRETERVWERLKIIIIIILILMIFIIIIMIRMLAKLMILLHPMYNL